MQILFKQWEILVQMEVLEQVIIMTKLEDGGGGGSIRIFMKNMSENIDCSKITVNGGSGASKSKAVGGKGGIGTAIVNVIENGNSILYWKR